MTTTRPASPIGDCGFVVVVVPDRPVVFGEGVPVVGELVVVGPSVTTAGAVVETACVDGDEVDLGAAWPDEQAAAVPTASADHSRVAARQRNTRWKAVSPGYPRRLPGKP
jgi:hypothetical protein